MARNRVLVVEDDESVQDRYKWFFEDAHRNRFEWILAESGEHAQRLLQAACFDLIVLDLRLPRMSGRDFLKWRKTEPAIRYVPVIVVSGQAQLPDRIEALNLGADDFLGKDFASEELLAKLDALLRRQEAALLRNGLFDLGWLQFDPGANQVTVDGETVQLKPQELALLAIFLRRPDMIHRTADLYARVCEKTGPDHEHAIGNRVSSLRRKLGRGGACLVSHKGIGYSLDSRVSPAGMRSSA